MRTLAAVVAVTASLASGAARAESGACTTDADCTAPAVCRIANAICVREAVDAASLAAAITAANADAARDVIVIGSANPDGNEGETVIAFDTPALTDPDFGPVALPVVTTPITIKGNAVGLATLDDNDNVRMFLVRPDPVLDVQPDLRLESLTVVDARPGANAAGDVIGGGAVHVTDVATTGGLLSTFTAANVHFTSSGDDDAVGDGVLSLAGGDALLQNCTFDANHGHAAGCVTSSATSLTITGGDFSDNSGDEAGVLSVSTNTTITDATFDSNSGGTAGVLVASGGSLRITGGALTENTSDTGVGGISTATDTLIAGGTGFTHNRGGPVGAVDATAATRDDGTGTLVPVTLGINTAVVENGRGDVTGGVRSLARTTLLNDTFTGNVARDGASVGGAVLSRSLSIQGGTYQGNFAPAGGGAVAVLDEPPSDAVRIAGARFDSNTTHGDGGAVLHVGATLALTDNTFVANEANGAGAAVLVRDLVDRNGAAPDADISHNNIKNNLSRPNITLTAASPGVDELGQTVGSIDLKLAGSGSAVVVDGAGAVALHNNCIMGNGAPAVDVKNSGAVDASGNWWGFASGPGPTGDGDFVGAAVTSSASTFLESPVDICQSESFGTYARVFVSASLSPPGDGIADVGVDYHILDRLRGIQVLNEIDSDVVPDLRRGVLSLDVVGVNDAVEEGPETFDFALPDCGGADCPYHVTGIAPVRFTITDNGDGGAEGEGEGEGDACVESLKTSPSALLLPDTGQASSASLKVENASACPVQLFSPIMHKGASQGFSVDPILQSKLALQPGDSIILIVRFTPPDPAGAAAASDAPPAGVLQLETGRGTLLKVNVGLVDNCSCTSSTSSRVPAEGVAGGALLVALALRRRRRAVK